MTKRSMVMHLSDFPASRQYPFVEATNFAVRYNPQIKRYYQRKMSRTNGVVAIKAVAHKLA
jgi:transposase